MIFFVYVLKCFLKSLTHFDFTLSAHVYLIHVYKVQIICIYFLSIISVVNDHFQFMK